MASEMLSLLAWANVTLAAGILIVLALRMPVRRLAGARVAYALWLLPLFSFLAWLAPARQISLVLPPDQSEYAVETALAAPASDMPALIFVTVWVMGVAGMMAIFAMRQRLFVQSAGTLEPVAELGHGVFSAAPSHGPAVVGALRPIILLPRDFDTRFSTEERTLVLAHERTHVSRHDPMVNAVAMGLRAVSWFNPLVHIASHALRIDQELACDAAVLARHSNSRRVYAEAMLKTHAAAFHVPVGCAWNSPHFHSLKERILMLKSSPSRLGRGLGLSLIAVAAMSACGAVWLMRPVEVLASPAPEQPVSVSEAEDGLNDLDDLDALDMPIEAEDIDDVEPEDDADLEALGMEEEDVRTKTRLALKEAEAAIEAARKDAARQAVIAVKAARAAMTDARLAMLEKIEPEIAAARQAISHVQPAIIAARQEAMKAAQRAEHDARRAKAEASAMARLARACKRALDRTPSANLSTEEELRALEKLVCIPGRFGKPASSGANASGNGP